jgi:phosphatidylcholine synthase
VTIAAWLVHLYTASGLVCALLAAQAAIDYDYVWAFLYLWLQVVVDATDGALARWADVSRRLPGFSGSKLDDLVDYLAYVFVPALIVWRGPFVPDAWATPMAAAMLVASGYGFSRVHAKTPDHFFTGFPSYWNVVVLYFFLTRSALWINAGILAALCVLVFVPIRFVYPSRTPVLPVLTNVLGASWALVLLALLGTHPRASRALLFASFVFPVYYMGLSAALELRRVRASA